MILLAEAKVLDHSEAKLQRIMLRQQSIAWHNSLGSMLLVALLSTLYIIMYSEFKDLYIEFCGEAEADLCDMFASVL